MVSSNPGWLFCELTVTRITEWKSLFLKMSKYSSGIALWTGSVSASDTKKQKARALPRLFCHVLFILSFCVALSLQAHSHVQKQTDRRTHCHLLMHVSHRGIYNTSTQSKQGQLSFPQPSPPFHRKPCFPLILCDVMEFRQFTGITFGKAKGCLEVTVSARVSGWPLGRGGGNHTHRGIVCCWVRRRLGWNRTQHYWIQRQMMGNHDIFLKGNVPEMEIRQSA